MAPGKAKRERLVYKLLHKHPYRRVAQMDDIYGLLVHRLHFDYRVGEAAAKAVGSLLAVVNGRAKEIALSMFSTRDEFHFFFRAQPPADRRVKRALEAVFERD